MACGGGCGLQHIWWREEDRVMADGSAYIDTLSKNFSSHDLYVKINEKKLMNILLVFKI